MGGALLVASEDVLHRSVVEHVVQGYDRPTGKAEDLLHPGLDETVDDDLGSLLLS